ncbi:uncharacterized protein [Pseudochaenichthys georgianus]|uniref:uncharacterized protein n=1 Tax=Pseudochaenichthys georgianus TaxID=52239 RepID=UPI00146DC54B|nr:uncharacterized protein LOC117450627 [Pseudochaenichthys georgianus]
MYRCNGVCCKSSHFHCCYCGEIRTQPTILKHVQKCAGAAYSVGSLRQTATVSSSAATVSSSAATVSSSAATVSSTASTVASSVSSTASTVSSPASTVVSPVSPADYTIGPAACSVGSLRHTSTVASSASTVASSASTVASSASTVASSASSVASSASTVASTVAYPVTSAASQIATASVASTPLQAISRSKVVQSRAKRTTCPLCKTELYMKNLKTHMDRRHSSSVPDITYNHHLPSQCLDLKKGIFAVGRTFSGLRNPIHVQKFTWGNSHQVVCELENCKQASEFSRSHLLGSECIHVRSLVYCPTSSKPDVTLKEEVLSDMVGKEWISDDTKRMCLVRKEKAESENSPLSKVVTFCSGASRVYVSVLETCTSYYSRLGRVSVCYDIKRNTWQCPCAKPKNSCAHKSIAKWHLNQTRPELFLKVRSTDSDVFETFVESDPEGHSTEDILYPPEGAALTSIVLYLLDHKKLPAVLSTDACSPQNMETQPKRLIPL